MKRFVVLGLALILLSQAVLADTYTLVERQDLPYQYVNDPHKHRSYPITDYSYEELDYWLRTNANFHKWNDADRVCDSLVIMFGRISQACHNLPKERYVAPEPDVYVHPEYDVRSATRNVNLDRYEDRYRYDDRYYDDRYDNRRTTTRTIYVQQPRYEPRPVVQPRVWYPWG